MKVAKLLTLAAAVAAASSAYAMQAMDDSSMSNATGQDGIDINLQNTNVTIDYLRWGTQSGMSTQNPTFATGQTGFGAGYTDPSATYTNPAYIELAGFGVTGGSTDIQLSMGANSAGQAALRVNLSANKLTFNPFVVSLAGASSSAAYQTQLLADSSVQTKFNVAVTGTGTATGTVTVANSTGLQNGMFAVNLGTVSIPAAQLIVSQGFTMFSGASSTPVSASGITIENAGCAGSCVSISGLRVYSPVDNANLFAASSISINDMGTSYISVGALSAADAKAVGAGASQGATGGTGALWLSLSPSTIGSVSIQGVQIGDAASTAKVGDLALVGVHLGANNIFISALK